MPSRSYLEIRRSIEAANDLAGEELEALVQLLLDKQPARPEPPSQAESAMPEEQLERVMSEDLERVLSESLLEDGDAMEVKLRSETGVVPITVQGSDLIVASARRGLGLSERARVTVAFGGDRVDPEWTFEDAAAEEGAVIDVVVNAQEERTLQCPKNPESQPVNSQSEVEITHISGWNKRPLRDLKVFMREGTHVEYEKQADAWTCLFDGSQELDRNGVSPDTQNWNGELARPFVIPEGTTAGVCIYGTGNCSVGQSQLEDRQPCCEPLFQDEHITVLVGKGCDGRLFAGDEKLPSWNHPNSRGRRGFVGTIRYLG